MLNKLQAVANRFEELSARSEQPDFYNDPKKAAAILRASSSVQRRSALRSGSSLSLRKFGSIQMPSYSPAETPNTAETSQ